MTLPPDVRSVSYICSVWEGLDMRLSRLVLLAIPALAASAAQAQDAPADLNQFGLICFCNSRISTPHRLVAMDNNGQLLFAARNGVTREQLQASGIAFTESQLVMLKDWGLLTEKAKRLTTNFPVLEPSRMDALRAKLNPIAEQLVPKVQPDVLAIKAELKRRHQEQWLYAALFSYVLDGKLWNSLESTGNLPNTDISIEHPFWSGTFWAVYPKQDDMPGTNSRRVGDAAADFLWSPATVSESNKLQSSDAVMSWLKALSDHSPAAALPFSGTAPLVIREYANDPIFTAGVHMANQIGPVLGSADFSAELPQADASQRLLIATHEFIWILLADLVRTHRIGIPPVLSKGPSQPSDLAPVILAYVRPAGTTSRH